MSVWHIDDVEVSEPDDYLTMPHRTSSVQSLGKDNLDVVDGVEEKSEVENMFPKCFESGVFCYDMSLNDEGSTEAKAHYHCPSCLRHCESTLNFITSHHKECSSAQPKVLIPTLCHHDSHIPFTECKSGDATCPVFSAPAAVKTPAHYHCPCCLFFAHQNLFTVIKHQLNCCKSMMSWNPGNSLPETSNDTVCNHLDESDVKFKICYKSERGCHGDRRRECHFHCPCCDNFSDSVLSQLKNHQRTCCKMSDENFPRPTYLRMTFVLNIATAIDQRLINGNILDSDRKRKNLKTPVKLEKLDDCLFSKCLDESCDVKRTHYHCPLCKIYSSRRIKVLKNHYMKCINGDIKPGGRSSKRAKLFARTAVGELQCVVVDKTNGVFLVRGSLTGPGMPGHVIYKPPHQYYCDDGCRNTEYDSQCCKHLDACATFVKNGVINNYHKMSSEVQNLKVLGSLLRVDESSKEQIITLFQQCSDLGVPVIKHFKPVNVSSKYPSYIFLSVSSCTSPRYYTRSGRVKVTLNVKKDQYKCKCFDSDCVHEVVSQLYLEHNDIVDKPRYDRYSFKLEPS